MHQLDEGRAASIGFSGPLAAVLLDPLGGAEETDDGIFALGTLVRGTLGGLASGVHAQRQVLA